MHLFACIYKYKVSLEILNDTQSAFLSGRNILDRILIANEIINPSLEKQRKTKGIIIKLDFEKVHGKVNWAYQLHLMSKLGFGQRRCSYRNLINFQYGSPTKFFKMEKGLRQDDPISPFSFLD